MDELFVNFLTNELGISEADVFNLLENNPKAIVGALVGIIGIESDKIDINYDHDDTRITMAENTLSKVFKYMDQIQP